MDQPLEWLPRQTQIRLMRSLAVEALAAYDLPAARLTLLKHRHNTCFRVDAEDGERYVLRINRAGTPAVESVGAELSWLEALTRDTSLEVPSPVPTRSRSLLTLVGAPAGRGTGSRPHICVVFRWLDGRRVVQGLTPSHLRLVGELMARLQDHAAGFALPRPLWRGRVDGLTDAARRLSDPFSPEVVAACHRLVAETLSTEEAERVGAVVERVRAAERALGQDPAHFGLMHADLHHNNLLFARDTVQARGAVKAIDFDDCGFGPLLYDLAVPLAVLQGRPAYPALRAGLLAGYRQVRRLPPDEEALVDTFVALRRVQDALWALAARRHPAIDLDWAAQARRVLAPLAGFLARGGSFPDGGGP